MGESLGRIKEWAQKHPWLAALILGAVVLVGYLVYKHFQSSSSSSGTPATTAPTDTGTVTPDAGTQIPASASSGLGGQSSGGEITAPSSNVGVGAGGLPSMSTTYPILMTSSSLPVMKEAQEPGIQKAAAAPIQKEQPKPTQKETLKQGHEAITKAGPPSLAEMFFQTAGKEVVVKAPVPPKQAPAKSAKAEQMR